jgi:peptidyl-prolyl cis-trans isomerase D
MLDRMRRHKAWLKWSLGIVVVTFVLLYVPSFLTPAGVGAAPTDVLATVEGRDVTVGTFNRLYQQQINSLRTAYGESVNEQMLRQLGIGQRIVQQLIDQEAVVAEADRLGIRVTDGELRERIVRMPGLQENGQFIGDARYRALLQMQRPPVQPHEFEAELRKSLMADKLQLAVAGWITVADADVEAEYRKRNEKVKLELAIFTADRFRGTIQPADAEIQAHFDANTETYRVPEKRRVRYLSIDAEALRSRMTVTQQEAEARYRQNMQMYSTPDQIRASHILLKTEGKDEATVRKQAEAVLAKVKAGEDFAALAKQYSEDTSKDNGGDLDYFGRGAMVKEFDEAAWALQPGQTTDLVKTQYGFHIIKLTDRRAASTKTFAEVRAQVEDQIKWEKAQAEATRLAGGIADDIDDPSDLDRVAQANGLAVADSGLFASGEPLAGLGFAPAVSAEAFTMEPGKVSGRLNTQQGAAFIHLVEIKPSYLPALSEVREKVRDDVTRAKAVDVARQRAQTMAQAAARGSFAAAAKAAGVEVKTTELVTRGTALPEVGVSKPVEDAVFALQANQTTAPIATENAVVVARVVERQDVKPDDLQAAKDGLRTELLQQRRGEFFGAYMQKAKQQMRIEYHENAIRAILGGQ